MGTPKVTPRVTPNVSRSGSSSSLSSSSERVGAKKVENQGDADLKGVHKRAKSGEDADTVVDVAGTLASGTKAKRKEARAEKREKAQAKQPAAPQRNPNVVKVDDSSSEVSLSSSPSSSSSNNVSKEDSDDETGNDQQSRSTVGDKLPGEGEALHKTRKKGPPAPNYDPSPGFQVQHGTDIDQVRLPPQAVLPAHHFASEETRELAGRYLTAMADLKTDRPANSKERSARSFAAGFVGYAPFALGSFVAGPFGKAGLGGWAEPVAWTIMGTLDVFQGEIWLPLIHKDSVGSESTSKFHEHIKAQAGHSTSRMGAGEATSAWLTMKKTDDWPFMMMPLSNAIPEILAQPGYFKENPAAEYAIKQFGFAFLLSGLAVKTLADLRIAAHPDSFVPEKTKEVLELQKAALTSLMRDLENELEEIIEPTSSETSEVVDDASSDSAQSEDGGASMQRHVLNNVKDRVELQLKATELALKGKSAVLGHKLKTMFTPGHVDGARKTAMMVASRCISLAAGGLVTSGFGQAFTAAGAPPLAVATVPPFVGQFFGYCMRQEYNAVLNYWSYYVGGITKGFPTKDDEPINPYDPNSPLLRQADALQGMPPPRAKAALDAQATAVAKPPDSQIASIPTIKPSTQMPTHKLPLGESGSSDSDEA